MEEHEMKQFMRQFWRVCLCSAFCMGSSTVFAQNTDANVSSFLQEVITEGNLKLEDARSASDVAQMDCLNAILIQAKGYLNVAQTSEMNLMDAQQRNDESSVAHNQKLLNLAYSKGQELSLSMNQCSTGIINNAGETSLKSSYACKYEPCETDPDFDVTTREGNNAFEQDIIEQIVNSTLVASPYL